MQVYEPREDSELFVRVLKTIDFTGKRVLDVGCGSGILSKTVAEQGGNIIGVDINPDAVAATLALGVEAFVSDIFSAVSAKFDYIICNAPYLPAHETDDELDEGERLAISGGLAWIEKFLADAQRFLCRGGKVLLLFSTHSEPKKLFAFADTWLYTYKELDKISIMMEELFVYEFVRTPVVEELYEHGVSSLSYLDKGKHGLLFTGLFDGKKVAIKMKRPDSDALNTVLREAKFLEILNRSGIGPQLHFSTSEFVVRDFVNGQRIGDFLELHPEQRVSVFVEVFRQCRIMDDLGIEKQEMTNPYKHILIDGEHIVMIDFERCRFVDAPGNVTQFVEYVIRLSKHMGGAVDEQRLRSLAAEYKHGRDVFEQIIACISQKPL